MQSSNLHWNRMRRLQLSTPWRLYQPETAHRRRPATSRSGCWIGASCSRLPGSFKAWCWNSPASVEGSPIHWSFYFVYKGRWSPSHCIETAQRRAFILIRRRGQWDTWPSEEWLQTNFGARTCTQKGQDEWLPLASLSDQIHHSDFEKTKEENGSHLISPRFGDPPNIMNHFFNSTLGI